MDENEGNGRRVDDVVMHIVSINVGVHPQRSVLSGLCEGIARFAKRSEGPRLRSNHLIERYPHCAYSSLRLGTGGKLSPAAGANYILATATICDGKGALTSLPGQTPSTRRAALARQLFSHLVPEPLRVEEQPIEIEHNGVDHAGT